MKPSVVVTAADLAQDRHPRSRVLRRRPVLPGRQDAALSGPAGRAVDLRDLRRLRSGAARAARRDLRQVRRGDRPRRDAKLWRLSFYACGRRRRLMRPMSIRRSRPAGSVRALPEHGASGLGAARDRKRRRLTPRPRPMASRSAPSSRRDNPALLVLDREFETQSVDPMFLEPESGLAWYNRTGAKTSSSCSACSRPTRPRNRSRYLLGKAARSVQAGAHQCPVCLYGRRIRRTRPHPVPALCRAGGDVLRRPSGAAGA